MEINVLNEKNEVVKKVELNDNIFNVKVNEHLIHFVIKGYLANKRQGTQSAKTRAEVSGSGKKPWKQKGTGRARAGSVRSPLWRHGGMIFAVKPRDYRMKLTRKIKVQALLQAISQNIKENKIKVYEKLPDFTGKTKNFTKWLDTCGFKDKKTLFVLNDLSKDFSLTSRNVKSIELVSTNKINSYHCMKNENIVFTLDSLLKFQEERGKINA